MINYDSLKKGYRYYSKTYGWMTFTRFHHDHNMAEFNNYNGSFLISCSDIRIDRYRIKRFGKADSAEPTRAGYQVGHSASLDGLMLEIYVNNYNSLAPIRYQDPIRNYPIPPIVYGGFAAVSGTACQQHQMGVQQATDNSCYPNRRLIVEESRRCVARRTGMTGIYEFHYPISFIDRHRCEFQEIEAWYRVSSTRSTHSYGTYHFREPIDWRDDE